MSLVVEWTISERIRILSPPRRQKVGDAPQLHRRMKIGIFESRICNAPAVSSTEPAKALLSLMGVQFLDHNQSHGTGFGGDHSVRPRSISHTTDLDLLRRFLANRIPRLWPKTSPRPALHSSGR